MTYGGPGASGAEANRRRIGRRIGAGGLRARPRGASPARTSCGRRPPRGCASEVFPDWRAVGCRVPVAPVLGAALPVLRRPDRGKLAAVGFWRGSLAMSRCRARALRGRPPAGRASRAPSGFAYSDSAVRPGDPPQPRPDDLSCAQAHCGVGACRRADIGRRKECPGGALPGPPVGAIGRLASVDGPAFAPPSGTQELSCSPTRVRLCRDCDATPPPITIFRGIRR